MQFGLVGGCCDPETGEPAALRFDQRYLEIQQQGPSAVAADMLTIASVAKRPERSFKGLKRHGKAIAYALLGRPTERFSFGANGDLVATPVTGKKIFLVFVDNLCIYHHAWIDLDFEAPGDCATEAEDRYVTMCFEQEITHARRR